jgi:hypothetical protein
MPGVLKRQRKANYALSMGDIDNFRSNATPSRDMRSDGDQYEIFIQYIKTSAGRRKPQLLIFI